MFAGLRSAFGRTKLLRDEASEHKHLMKLEGTLDFWSRLLQVRSECLDDH